MLAAEAWWGLDFSPTGSVEVLIRDQSSYSKYVFGTKTADFPAAHAAASSQSSTIDGQTYAVVSVNAMNGVEQPC
ncbi:MAG: hypothetical protein U1F68_05970 [Gammaproteobacteria bacterium]